MNTRETKPDSTVSESRNDRMDFQTRLIAGICRLLCATLRISVTNHTDIDPRRHQGLLLCFWHEYILPVSWFFRGSGIVSMISTSRDGERIAALMRHWGIHAVRGSSTRQGASALRSCLRHLKLRDNVIITPDGPRGPRRTAKPGVAQISQIAATAVIPVRVEPGRCWRLGSWDRFAIPYPFSTVRIHFGQPLQIEHTSGTSDDHARATLTSRIEEALG